VVTVGVFYMSRHPFAKGRLCLRQGELTLWFRPEAVFPGPGKENCDMSEDRPVVSFDDFCKLDLRVVTVLEVSDHPNADKLLCLKIDIGGGQTRQIIAGLKGHYVHENLLGRQIVVVTNIQPRKMRGLESQGMLLAAVSGEGDAMQVVVLTPEREVPPGTSVS